MKIKREDHIDEDYHFGDEGAVLPIHRIWYVKRGDGAHYTETLSVFLNPNYPENEKRDSFLVIRSNNGELSLSDDTKKYFDLSRRLFNSMPVNEKTNLLGSLSLQARRLFGYGFNI